MHTFLSSYNKILPRFKINFLLILSYDICINFSTVLNIEDYNQFTTVDTTIKVDVGVKHNQVTFYTPDKTEYAKKNYILFCFINISLQHDI